MKYKYSLAFALFFIPHFTVMAQTSKISIDSLVSLVKQAYIYGYPIEQSYRMYVTTPDNTGQAKRLYNHFSYSNKLAEASKDNTTKIETYLATRNRGGAGPNSDTPYFGSLLDLSEGPIVLSAPNFGKRYYSFHFINFFNQNVFYIGYHFGDTTADNYLLIGPGWKGKVPVGLKPIRFKDNRLNLFGRVLVEDDSLDLKKVIALQHQASLTPLSKWPAEQVSYAGDEHPEFPTYYAPIDSFFTNLNHALRLSPPPVQDKVILTKLKLLGVGTNKGFIWGNYDKASQLRVHASLIQTDSLLDAEAASGDVDFGNGWQRTNPLIGKWGTDYWDEALYIKHGFYAGNTETENFYIIPKSREGHGFFKGNHKYLIHFAKGTLPPLQPYGFGSMTAYEIPGYFLLPNPIHRPAIRDRSKNLKYNSDGSLDIYLQADSPGPDKESNWLPITKKESTVTFRVYLPKESLLKNAYKLPPIQIVD